nr:MAG TPA: Avd-like protein [Caudoviricetes sp.]
MLLTLTGEAGRNFFCAEGGNGMAESVERGLVLQQKWEDLSEYLFACVLRDMPKSERFTLGSDIRATVWEVEAALVQLSLRAGNRWALLNLVDVKAKVLLAMIRLGIRIGAIPQKRYEPLSTRLVEIGKIVGGLKKSGGERPDR